MLCRRRLSLAALALVCSGTIGAAGERLHKTLASPLVDEGTGPDGCTPALTGRGGPPSWEVRVERLLPDGKALAETSLEPDAERFPLCIADTPLATNAEVELEFVAREGQVDRAAGIVVRFADPQDYYVAEASARQNSVALVRVVNGTQTRIGARQAPVASGRPQKLKIRMLGDRFSVWLNEEFMFAARDAALVVPGRFGIWSRGDSFTRFGDLFITVLD